ncbi:hypothetical protein BV25DRAFT_1988088 [Artomyces pyxidatus]|uniref:Uncharacterized protein n=1 Tax=Artomyces pyxidatus TaxID=48021 RepID=A0ACB8TF04_9AGAM|nr:hypothetical protein BV25DRAFT_1988088 [Artomyces pyxidatus]
MSRLLRQGKVSPADYHQDQAMSCLREYSRYRAGASHQARGPAPQLGDCCQLAAVMSMQACSSFWHGPHIGSRFVRPKITTSIYLEAGRTRRRGIKPAMQHSPSSSHRGYPLLNNPKQLHTSLTLDMNFFTALISLVMVVAVSAAPTLENDLKREPTDALAERRQELEVTSWSRNTSLRVRQIVALDLYCRES